MFLSAIACILYWQEKFITWWFNSEENSKLVSSSILRFFFLLAEPIAYFFFLFSRIEDWLLLHLFISSPTGSFVSNRAQVLLVVARLKTILEFVDLLWTPSSTPKWKEGRITFSLLLPHSRVKNNFWRFPRGGQTPAQEFICDWQ